MLLTRGDETTQPLITDSGERIYEMINTETAGGRDIGQSLALSRVAPGRHSAAHWHEQASEILYILEGEGQLHVDEKRYVLKAGDACLLEPGEVHSLFNVHADDDLVLLAVTAPPWSAADVHSAEAAQEKP